MSNPREAGRDALEVSHANFPQKISKNLLMRLATRFETLIAPLHHPLLSIAINLLSLLAPLRSHPTRRHPGTPLQRSLPFLAPLFLASGLLHYLWISPISNTFVLPMQWSTFSSHLFAGKTHQVTDRLVHSGPGSAASLGVPTRLKDWIRGYLEMLPSPATRSRKHEGLQPRRILPIS